jgi:hypothetical protein
MSSALFSPETINNQIVLIIDIVSIDAVSTSE